MHSSRAGERESTLKRDFILLIRYMTFSFDPMSIRATQLTVTKVAHHCAEGHSPTQ